MEGARKVRGRYVGGAQKVHGRCTEGAQKVRRRCAEGVMPMILLAMVDSLRTLKVHHCLSMVTINWLPLATIDLVGDNREFEV